MYFEAKILIAMTASLKVSACLDKNLSIVL